MVRIHSETPFFQPIGDDLSGTGRYPWKPFQKGAHELDGKGVCWVQFPAAELSTLRLHCAQIDKPLVS